MPQTPRPASACVGGLLALLAVVLYRIDTDTDCIDNLAGYEEFAGLKEQLRNQMVAELTAQEDP